MGILLACMYVHHMHAGPKEPEEGTFETELQTVVAVMWKWGATAHNH